MISQSATLAKLLPFVKQCQAVCCNKDILTHQLSLVLEMQLQKFLCIHMERNEGLWKSDPLLVSWA